MNAADGLRYDRYSVAGHSEWVMRIGPAGGIPILFVPPLFEEMNRTRAYLATTMRRLAASGFVCALPDLPGTGESERALESCEWTDWTGAVDALADRTRSPDGKLLIATLRGGALLADIKDAVVWRFAPAEGSALLRDLNRSGLVGGDSGAGYPIPDSIAAAMEQATPPEAATVRTVRLASDPKPADAKLEGPALWRRSEPSNAIELARSSACDIEMWARQCGVC